ncbi:MAG: TolC family protein [Verrucomicrobia bacterium]|nr:TolC family protein [Verrucomicrobiota bacterium]
MKPLCLFLVVATAAHAVSPTNRLENLTLEQAIALAEGQHPGLAEARALIDAADGRARQAGAFPNPEAIVGAQQIPFSGNAPNEKEYVAGVGQTIPLGGRLGKARQAELLDREVRARGLEVKRRDIRKRVHSAFATALYQEKACQAQTEIQRNAEKAVVTTQARVEAGDALREDAARVEMELARAKIELKRAESLREQALVTLASAMGDATLSVKSLVGTLDATFEIPTLETLAANVSAQPESALADADIRARNARVDAAKAERIPDVKVELLYHRLESSQQNTFDVGLSIPLPLFNRNQGKLREARAEVAAAEARSRMTQNELTTRLRESHLQLTAALANSRTLKAEILSRAETVLKGAEARYAAGDISLADVLPVRRDWAAVQLSYLESLRDVMQAWAELRHWSR